MADEKGKISLDPVRGRIISLGFKKATEGLTPAEEQELARLKQQEALRRAQEGSGS
jgi:hypothetical protein